MVVPYRERTPLAERQREAARVRAAHPDRVPILLVPASRACPPAENDRFLAPLELTVAQFAYAVRKRVKLQPSQAIFLHVDGRLASGTAALGALDARHRGDDGFLAVTYALENAFGAYRRARFGGASAARAAS
jgi:hypothetical protein